MTSILIVDDDPLVADFLDRALRAAGYVTTVVGDTARARLLGLSGAFDLILLDLVLTDGDGFTVLRELRERRRTLPVLVMTGHPQQRDVVECLDGGADDYLVKPVRLKELLARIRVRLRSVKDEAGTELSAGDLGLDLLSRRVTIAGREIVLTAREYMLLETFLRHPDQVLSREQLIYHVWGFDVDPNSNVVNTYVAMLRGKIGNDRIETLRGAGYRLRVAGVVSTS
jgi:two-component system, OmpR family, copper resistance phosphate regulon response regulator CusR